MRILIAEDDITSRLVLERMLTRWGNDVIVTADGTEAWDRLQAPDPPRLLILDRLMPGMDGLEICRALRERETVDDPYTYIILLTGLDDKDQIVQGMEAGADDYITKPYNQHELRARLNAGQRLLDLNRRLLAAEEELRRQAATDPLTGALNRRAILGRLQAEIDRAARTGECFAVSLLDIDHFKVVNDTYGHVTGDHVLRECVQRLRTESRIYDALGRFGGEEFLIIAPGVGPAEAFELFDRLRRACSEHPFASGPDSVSITVSQGFVTSRGESDLDEVVTMADRALYDAKRKGRNRVETSGPAITHPKPVARTLR